jgi:hypothetical protein
MIRFSCLGAFLVAFALAGPASAAGGCGVGLSQHVRGSVRLRRMAGGFARLERVPGHIPPTPPCGPYHQWGRRSMMCIPT